MFKSNLCSQEPVALCLDAICISLAVCDITTSFFLLVSVFYRGLLEKGCWDFLGLNFAEKWNVSALPHVLFVVFVLLALLVCHDDADPQGVEDGVVSVGVVWWEGKPMKQVLQSSGSLPHESEQNWTHLDLVGRCHTGGSCRLFGSLEAERNRCRRWCLGGGMRLSWFGKHRVQKDCGNTHNFAEAPLELYVGLTRMVDVGLAVFTPQGKLVVHWGRHKNKKSNWFDQINQLIFRLMQLWMRLIYSGCSLLLFLGHIQTIMRAQTSQNLGFLQ